MGLSKLFKSSKKGQSNHISDALIHEIATQRGNVDNLYPSDFTAQEIDQIQQVRPYTMTSLERLVTLYRSIDYINQNVIEGDYAECGVWKGGGMMLIANKLLSLGISDKKLFLFDTFEGMSEPTNVDRSFDNKDASVLLHKETNKEEGNNIWCYSSLEEVKNNLSKTGYDLNNIKFIKGKVEETLPYDEIDKLALLRLDTDWYESTKHELETLYDKLVVGGVLIIDDYGHWSGSKKAVDEFIKNRKLNLFLNRVDYTCRLAIKMS